MNPSETSVPKIFIGVPCFNARNTVLNTLESIQNQTFRDFMVLVSDDCSSDGSHNLVMDFVKSDARFTLCRQEKNLGLYQNFKFLFEQSACEYFMWLASDDSISPDYLEKNYLFLNTHPDYSASSGKPVYLYGDSKEFGRAINLSGSPSERMMNLLRNVGWSHAIFYSLMRSNILGEFRELGRSYAAADWSLDLHLVLNGKVNTGNFGEIYFGTSGVSRGKNANRKFANSPLEYFFPMLRFSRILIQQVKVSLGFKLIPWRFLLHLNLNEVKRDFVMFKKSILNKDIP